MRRFNDSKYQTMCILGSFNKHYDTIVKTATYFKERGLIVLAPEISAVKSNNDGYVFLESDKSTNPVIVEREFLKKCIDSDFVYVCNKDGYLGKTVMLELGYMLGKGQEVYFMEKPIEEKLIMEMTEKSLERLVASPEQLVEMIEMYNNFSWLTPGGQDMFDRSFTPKPGFRFPEANKER